MGRTGNNFPSLLLSRLSKEREWIQQALERVRHSATSSSSPAELRLRDVLLEKLRILDRSSLELYEKLLIETRSGDRPSITIDTSECIKIVDFDRVMYNNSYEGKHFHHPLKQSDPLVVVALFLALVLQVLGGVARKVCNLTLKLLKSFLELALGRDGRMLTKTDRDILAHFPSDIRTVRHLFGMDPTVVVWAACPSCSATYPPVHSSDRTPIPVYPARCTSKAFSNSQPCNARLTKNGVLNGESIRVPIRSFPVQDFHAFVGRLLSQPEVEDALQQNVRLASSGVLRDIAQGTGITEMYDAYQTKVSGDKSDDLLLLWAFSVDWFNPFLNKAAGKSVSDGSMAMICLSLPPSLRLLSSNVFLAAIIPPPEPSQEAVNHFLRPTVDQLVDAWEHGVRYTRTHRRLHGRRVRSAVALEVSDLPASRKISGLAGHQAGCFCGLCELKRSQIHNIDASSWVPKTRDKVLEQAIAWRDAPNRATRKKLYKANGVRWSELYRLPYWDPTRHVIIDGMHTMFLNIVQHHFRTIINMDMLDDNKSDGRTTGKTVTTEMLTKLSDRLATASSPQQLETFNKTLLWEFCRHRNLDMRKMTFEKAKKRTLANILLVSMYALNSDE